MNAEIEYTERGHNAYYVLVDGQEIGHYGSEREASEAAVNAALANPEADVHYERRYSVDVALAGDLGGDPSGGDDDDDDGGHDCDDDGDGSDSGDEGDDEDDDEDDDEGDDEDDGQDDPGDGDETPPANPPGASNEPAKLVARVDGKAIEIEAKPGERKRVGDLSLWHTGDGAVCIENCYADSSGDTQLTEAKLTLGSSNTLFEGDALVYRHAMLRPFWYIQPKLKADWDRALVPNYGKGSEAASYADKYASHDPGPNSRGLFASPLHLTGDRADLGLLPAWDAAFVTNPSAENAEVVRGMADAAAPWSYHVLDPATDAMILTTDHPKVSALGQIKKWADPYLGGTHNPNESNTQAAAHAPAFGVLASVLFDTEYDRMTVAHWANWIGALAQNYSYRLHDGAGPVSFHHGQTRGFGWATRQIAAAAVLSDYKAYFTTWLGDFADQVQGVLEDQQPYLPVRRDLNRYSGRGVAPWENDFLMQGFGYAAQLGFAKAKTVAQLLGAFQVGRLLNDRPELAEPYTIAVKDHDGRWAKTWQEALEMSSSKIQAALKEKPGSQALQDVLKRGHQYKPGDFYGYPWSPEGYAAMLQPAIAYAVDVGVKDAAKAWAVFTDHARMDYSAEPKYNIVPAGKS